MTDWKDRFAQLENMALHQHEDTLTIWTVFRNPRDHPGQWVLRGFDVSAGRSAPRAECVVADTLDDIHAALPPGLTYLPRAEHDDPVIYESWV